MQYLWAVPGECCSRTHLFKHSQGEGQVHRARFNLLWGPSEVCSFLISAWFLFLVASCQLLQARAGSRVFPDPACPLASPLPKQGSATGFKQSWKLGAEARSRKEPSLLSSAWVGFCAAVGSTNMFPICSLH